MARQMGVGRWLWRHVYAPTLGVRLIAGFGLPGAATYLLGDRAMKRAAPQTPR